MTTLADLQRSPDADPPPDIGPSLPVIAQRTFDTPGFAGKRFLEVETKSVLNRVKGMPFEWSINLYRGCTMACAYCLAPDTPITMANGTVKPIDEVTVGDEVLGTSTEDGHRRYVPSRVLRTWRTTKPAYRVTLEDGTELITSGQHRFLTERGWKHVADAPEGCQQPHLTTNNRLIGYGNVPSAPKLDDDYRRGYLTGMLRGHASWGTYSYGDSDQFRVVHGFRLALADAEALDRSADWLALEGIQTTRFEFAPATATRRAMQAIRTSKRAGVDAVRRLVEWPAAPAEEWYRGFLGGIFDAEGSHDGQILRISNADDEILSTTLAAMAAIRVDAVREPARANGVASIRVRGGLPMRLRFIVATSPAISRKRRIDGLAVKSRGRTRVVAVQPLGLELPMVDLTTESHDFVAAGVISHNCFARPTHRYLNLNATSDFDDVIVVKTNAVEVLRAELAKPSWKGQHVAIGTNVDQYQRAEGRYELMPGVIEALAASLTPFSILTKGTLITRDIEVLQAAQERVPVAASLTVGMLDEDLWRRLEPGTPSPRARLDAVRQLNDAGIPTGVMLAPIMPALSDDADGLVALTDAAVEAGATHVTPITLHLRPGVKEAFWPWLEANHPELVGRYATLYGHPASPRKGRATLPDAEHDRLVGVVRRARDAAWRRAGGRPETGSWPGRQGVGAEISTGHAVQSATPARPQPEQLSLLG